MRTAMEVEVVRSKGVSLLGTKTPRAAGTKPKNYRLPLDVVEYLKEAKTQLGRDETEIVVSAVRLDREMGKRLADHSQRLNLYAASLGLSLERDLPEVLARLVIAGLDVIERKPKK